jgi:hypothetical protein
MLMFTKYLIYNHFKLAFQSVFFTFSIIQFLIKK